MLVNSVADAAKQIIKGALLLLDDIQCDMRVKSIADLITEYYTRKVHHYEFSCVLTLQRAFEKRTKTILDNARYCCLWDTPRSRNTITCIAKGLSPSNIAWVKDAYRRAIETPHGFLCIDYTVGIDERLRVRSFLYPQMTDNNFLFTES